MNHITAFKYNEFNKHWICCVIQYMLFPQISPAVMINCAYYTKQTRSPCLPLQSEVVFRKDDWRVVACEQIGIQCASWEVLGRKACTWLQQHASKFKSILFLNYCPPGKTLLKSSLTCAVRGMISWSTGWQKYSVRTTERPRKMIWFQWKWPFKVQTD